MSELSRKIVAKEEKKEEGEESKFYLLNPETEEIIELNENNINIIKDEELLALAKQNWELESIKNMMNLLM